MKRLFAILMFTAVACLSFAQIPFSIYKPVPIEPATRRNSPHHQQAQQDNYQTINAYYINNRGAFQKIRIKVNVVAGPLGGEQVYVRA